MFSSQPLKSGLTKAFLFGLLTLTALPAVAQERLSSENLKPESALTPQIVLTGDDVPAFLVTRHTYTHLLWGLAEGHDTWDGYVLAPLGIEPETRAEAALETFLLKVRDTVTKTLHVAYDTELESERFQQDQLDFRFQKMASLAIVHAEMIRLLEELGVGSQGLLALMEERIRPATTVEMSAGAEKTLTDLRAEQEAIFNYYDAAFAAARQGLELPVAQVRAHKSGSSGDVLSLSGSAYFPNCGEGLVSRRGWHSLQLVNKDRATTLTLNGRLKECGWIFDDFVGTGCNRVEAATASGQMISCTSTASDTVCRYMNEHRAWQSYYVQRNGMGALSSSNQSQCTKPNDCDDFQPSF